MKYSLSHIDTCCSSYFCGSHLPVIQVLVDENTTYMDIKLALLNHYDSVDHIEDIDLTAYDEAVHDLFSNFKSLDYVPDSFYGIGNMNDHDEWDLYMYFTLETIDEGEE
mgnify:CR=1 FL=1